MVVVGGGSKADRRRRGRRARCRALSAWADERRSREGREEPIVRTGAIINTVSAKVERKVGSRGDGRHWRGRGSVFVEGDKSGHDDVGKRGSVEDEVIKFDQSALK